MRSQCVSVSVVGLPKISCTNQMDMCSSQEEKYDQLQLIFRWFLKKKIKETLVVKTLLVDSMIPFES